MAIMHSRAKSPHVPFLDLSAQYEAIASEIDAAIAKVLLRGDFILGRDVHEFEEEFAAYCEVRHAVGVDSGTSALELALRAFEIGPGDEVITAANSFVASALAVSHTGATPVLADADPHTCTIDVAAVERAITPRTKAIIPVHLYGQPADMDPILSLGERHGLVVIEDACQAHGARYKGRRVGSLGHAAAFSFYPGKNLGAYGDGGMVVTDEASVASRLEMLRNYGQKQKYHHLTMGFNRRLDTLQAAILRVKLKYLDEWNDARRRHAALYNRMLRQGGVKTPVTPSYAEPVWHLYVICTERRNELREHLDSSGISTGIHYPVPIHLQPAYQHLGYKRGDFPVTEQQAWGVLSLPMYAELKPEHVAAVCKAVREFYAAATPGQMPVETCAQRTSPQL